MKTIFTLFLLGEDLQQLAIAGEPSHPPPGTSEKVSWICWSNETTLVYCPRSRLHNTEHKDRIGKEDHMGSEDHAKKEPLKPPPPQKKGRWESATHIKKEKVHLASGPMLPKSGYQAIHL